MVFLQVYLLHMSFWHQRHSRERSESREWLKKPLKCSLDSRVRGNDEAVLPLQKSQELKCYGYIHLI